MKLLRKISKNWEHMAKHTSQLFKLHGTMICLLPCADLARGALPLQKRIVLQFLYKPLIGSSAASSALTYFFTNVIHFSRKSCTSVPLPLMDVILRSRAWTYYLRQIISQTWISTTQLWDWILAKQSSGLRKRVGSIFKNCLFLPLKNYACNKCSRILSINTESGASQTHQPGKRTSEQ